MTAKTRVFFDDSLPRFVREVTELLGESALASGLVLRDSSGRLRFLSSGQSPSVEKRVSMEKQISMLMGAYVRTDGALSFADEPGVQRLLRDPATVPVQDGSRDFRLLDRRIVGSAWLDAPQEESSGPPRIVFASLKGGVGRSTALAVVASELSRQNKNVLVVDLDLEAPGMGDTLLAGDRIPRYGTVDYLVENGLGGILDEDLSDFVGTSSLTSSIGGRVDVVPALGRQAIRHPSNTLPKIARAMIEDVDRDGTSVTVASQIANMIRRFTDRDSYDVVLIDSRAGLSEIAAPAILGLGATVLLFGTAQQQTVQGYESLFAALKMLAERDRAAGGRAEWRFLFKAVYAKAGFDELVGLRHLDDLYDLFADNLYDADEVQKNDVDAFSFNINDQNAPHWPLVIPFSQNFLDFDPVRVPGQLNVSFYEQTYRSFLSGIDSILNSGDVILGNTEHKW